MVTKKVRYIIFKIHNNDDETLIDLNEASFINIFRDYMYEMYGTFGLIHFHDVRVTLFLLYNQILVLKVPRSMKCEICNAIKECKNVAGRNLRFEAVMTKSSIKRVKLYLKTNFKKEEELVGS